MQWVMIIVVSIGFLAFVITSIFKTDFDIAPVVWPFVTIAGLAFGTNLISYLKK